MPRASGIPSTLVMFMADDLSSNAELIARSIAPVPVLHAIFGSCLWTFKDIFLSRMTAAEGRVAEARGRYTLSGIVAGDAQGLRGWPQVRQFIGLLLGQRSRLWSPVGSHIRVLLWDTTRKGIVLMNFATPLKMKGIG